MNAASQNIVTWGHVANELMLLHCGIFVVAFILGFVIAAAISGQKLKAMRKAIAKIEPRLPRNITAEDMETILGFAARVARK